jgi:hypothetical protein
MGRSKLIITESEREEIRKSYNLNEQNSQSDNFLTDFLTGEKNIFKTLLSKLTGKDDESSVESLKHLQVMMVNLKYLKKVKNY